MIMTNTFNKPKLHTIWRKEGFASHNYREAWCSCPRLAIPELVHLGVCQSEACTFDRENFTAETWLA